MLCDMDLGLRYPRQCVLWGMLSLLAMPKKFATFSSLIIHWRGGISVVFMHKTLEALCTYGNARYLGYAWLIVCSFSKFLWSMGFANGVFVFLLILEAFTIDAFCG